MKPNAVLNFDSHLDQSLEKPVTTYNVLAKQLYLYKNKAAFYKTLTAENTIRIVKTAIALERYFLEHQKYPNTLDQLVPAFLPEVPLNLYDGQALLYEREVGNRFNLHAGGWDDQEKKDPQPPQKNRGKVTWKWPLE